MGEGWGRQNFSDVGVRWVLGAKALVSHTHVLRLVSYTLRGGQVDR